MRADAAVILVCIPLALPMVREPDHFMPAQLRLALAGSADGPWSECAASGEQDTCPVLYFNLVMQAGDAQLSVEPGCRGAWRHAWRQPDAHQTIAQWLDADAARGQGSVCIPLGRGVDAVVVTPLGGHCGYEGPWSEWTMPGPGGTLRRGGAGALGLVGCHARMDRQRFGGIAVRFADGYGFGSAYAGDQFYGVYDGFGAAEVGGTDASVFRLGDFNTFHYLVEILAGGGAGWSQAFPGENDK